MAVFDGHQELIDDLAKYAGEMDNDFLAEVLSEAGDIIVHAVSYGIDSRSGTLEKSIGHAPVHSTLGNGKVIGVDIGWRRIKRPDGSRSSFTNIYGPVLEFSDKRRMRHMLIGFDMSKSYAIDHMIQRVEKKLGK